MDRFEKEKQRLEEEIKILEHRYSVYGTVRFIVFLVMAAGIIIGVYDSKTVWLVAGFAAAVGFVTLVFLHGRVNENLEYARAKKLVCERYISRYSDDWKKFPEDGSEYLTDEDLVARDMDILGPNSLYQFVNVCGTEDGKRTLAATLKNPDFMPDEIVKRQAAVKELVGKQNFVVDFEALGVKAGMGKKKKYTSDVFVEYCNGDTHIPAIFNVLRFLLPVVTITLIVLAAASRISYAYPVISFFAVLLFAWGTSGVAGQAVMPMVSFGYVLEDYIRMFEMIAEEDFQADILKDIKQSISAESGALESVKKLKTICAAFNIRYNPVVHQLLCGLLMWDFHLGVMMDRWKNKNGEYVEGWIRAVSRLEELISLSVIDTTRAACYPEVTRHEKVSVKGMGLRHPLIDPSVVVANDADFQGGTTIITGSNMSGKTTFLRTLGVNLVLAYAGAPVCADTFKADYMKIFTSMRVTDDVSNGISTFYAEILRIKSMVEYRKCNKPMLCLIDEIFKGTNSADRIVGARRVISKLSAASSMTMVSTHDFELCDIENYDGSHAANYHFEEYYEGDQLKFDYRKKDGRCTTTNAMAILHMAGLD